LVSVIVIVPSGTQLSTECLFETGHQLLHRSINFRILQSALSILHNYTERKTFLTRINAFAGIHIE